MSRHDRVTGPRWIRTNTLARVALFGSAIALIALVAVYLLRREPAKAPRSASRDRSSVRSSAPEPEAFGTTRASPPAAVGGVVRAADGRPVDHARVCAVGVNDPPVGGPVAPCAFTAASGLYSFSGVAAGAYYVRAVAPGFAPGTANRGQPVVLAEGQSRSDLDIVLQPGGARVAGTVLDATGGPVPQAQVRVARTPWGEATEVVADDSGAFEAFISTGTVAVTARAPGYAPAYAFVVAPATGLNLVMSPGASISGVVTAKEGGEPVANVLVRAVPVGSWSFSAHPSAVTDAEGRFTVQGLQPGAYGVAAEAPGLRGTNDGPFRIGVAESVSGADIVVEAARKVVGNVVIQGTNEPCRQGDVLLNMPENSGTPVPTMMTELTPAGSAVFESVPVGRYSVTVRCSDHILAEGPRELSVVQDVTGVQWRVSRGVGLVVRVVDARDKPIPGYTFQLELPHAAGTSTPLMMLTADAEGRYEYPTILEPGRYVVSPSGNFKGDSVPVELRPGSGKTDVTLRLSGSSAIMVNVATPSGEPVDGVRVVALPLAQEAAAPSPPQASTAPPAPSFAGERVPTEAERAENQQVITRSREGRVAAALGGGRYRVAALEPGRYQVKVEDGMNPATSAGSGADATFQLLAGAEATTRVVLDRGEGIRGRVVDHAGGPLPNVWVSAVYEGDGDPNRRAQSVRALGGEAGPGQRVLTDLDGRFRLFNLVRGTEFALRAEDLHGLAAMRRHVKAGDEVTIEFAATGRLAGTLVIPRGAAGVTVQATHLETAQTRALLIQDPDGRWEMDGLAGGRLRIIATDEAGRMAHQIVDVPAGGKREDIRLVLEGPEPIADNAAANAAAAEPATAQ